VNLRTTRIPYRLFWVNLIFCTLYSSFRYPFRMGTSTTSPTYSDTPPAIQAGKFIIVLLLCSLSGLWTMIRPVKVKHAAIFPIVLFLLAFPLCKALLNYNTAYIDMTFWPMAALALALSVRKITTSSLNAFMSFLLFYSLITNAIEIFLFIAIGRLPEEAYANSIVVRFGAWLDAPNDFACILFLLMGWAFFRFHGVMRILIEASLITCLILTESLTAYGFFILLLIAVGINRALRNYHSMFLVTAIFVSVLLLFLFLPTADLVNTLMLNKAGSISDHLSSTDTWSGNWRTWLFIGSSTFQHYENWWLSSLINFGIIWFVLCTIAMTGLLSSLWNRLRISTGRTDKAVLSGLFLFSVYCVIGSVNLPLLMAFPVSFLFYLFCFLVLFDKLDYESMTRNG